MIAATTAALVAALVSLAVRRFEPVRPLAIGDAAPDFELSGSDGQVHRLSEFSGREAVVLAWFPRAFTPGCAAECRSLAATGSAPAGVRLFAASVDTPDTNRAFAAALGLTFPVLSDPDRRVARAYGVLGATGFPVRSTFFIGRDGRILDVDRRVRVGSHGDEVAARLRQLGLS